MSELGMLDARVERLERRLAERESVDRAEIDAGVARAVQSIGIVVDHLVASGLLCKEALRRHVEKNFRLMELDDMDGRAETAIDIYGWLVWAESSRFLRENASRPWETDLERGASEAAADPA